MKNDGISRYHRLYWYVVAAMILCLMCVYSAPVSYAGSVTSVGEMNLGTPHSSLGANSTSPSRFLSSLGNAPLSINRGLFYATVPSYATVAHNYTIEVLVVNNSTSPIPIFVASACGSNDSPSTFPSNSCRRKKSNIDQFFSHSLQHEICRPD